VMGNKEVHQLDPGALQLDVPLFGQNQDPRIRGNFSTEREQLHAPSLEPLIFQSGPRKPQKEAVSLGAGHRNRLSRL